MATGKQLSFQYGEISPLQKYNPSTDAYQTGLEALENMTVRRTGGVSNRAGTVVERAGSLTNSPDFDGYLGLSKIPSVRVIDVDSSNYGRVRFIFVRTTTTSGSNAYVIFSIHEKGVQSNFLITRGTFNFINPEDINKVEIQYTDGVFIITPSMQHEIGSTKAFYAYGSLSAIKEKDLPILPVVKLDFYTDNIGYDWGSFVPSISDIIYRTVADGSPPLNPVSYLFTAINKEGYETKLYYTGTSFDTNLTDSQFSISPLGGSWVRIDALVPDGTANLQQFAFPVNVAGAFLRNDFLFTPFFPEEIKEVRVYRSAEASFEDSAGGYYRDWEYKNYEYVGSIQVKEGQPKTFSDYGIGDPSFTPPIDKSLYRSSSFIRYVECASVYQQRQFWGLGSDPENANKYYEDGRIAASSVENSLKMQKPLVIRPAGAFDFTVPVEDQSRVYSIVSDTRLVVLTDKNAFVIAGQGEQGIVTATQINPLKISDVGVSKTVRAKKMAGLVIYLDTYHNKVMAIQNSNTGSTVIEVSSMSEHLIDKQIFGLEVVRSSNGDETAYMIRSDGQIIAATLTDAGLGFSRLSFENGIPLSIFKTTKKRIFDADFESIDEDFETLGIVMQRGNSVNFEYLDQRIDETELETSYLDCSVKFGYRLSKRGARGYKPINLGGINILQGLPDIATINIEAADYSSGSPLTLVSNYDLEEMGQSPLIRFFYGDDSIDFAVDYSSRFERFDGDFNYTAVSSYDVPEELRDIDSQDLSAAEKSLQKSRWLPALSDWGFELEASGLLDVIYEALDPSSFYNYNTGTRVIEDGSYTIGSIADDQVMSSPLDLETGLFESVITASGGSVSINAFPRAVCNGVVGIPYASDFVTLPIEPSDSRTFTDTKLIINKVGLALYNSNAPYIGGADTPNNLLVPTETRTDTDLSEKDTLFSGHVAPTISSDWKKEGKIRVRNLNPAPLTILSVYPKGISGE